MNVARDYELLYFDLTSAPSVATNSSFQEREPTSPEGAPLCYGGVVDLSREVLAW